MTDLAKLTAWRDRLEAARFQGAREVEDRNGQRTVFRSDAELERALAEVNQRIAALAGPAPVRTILLHTSKGT